MSHCQHMVLGYHYDNRDDCFHLHHADHHDNDDQHDQQHNRCDTVSILLLENHHDNCFHHPHHHNNDDQQHNRCDTVSMLLLGGNHSLMEDGEAQRLRVQINNFTFIYFFCFRFASQKVIHFRDTLRMEQMRRLLFLLSSTNNL